MGSDSKRFEGRNALVMGGSSGIGRAVVTALAAEGARVVACGRDPAKLAQLRSQLPERVETAVADMQDSAAVRDLVDETVSSLGSIDVLVNSAGIAYMEPFLDITAETWRETIETNLTGAFFASQAAARHMVAAGRGSIVNIASIDAFVAESPFAHYNASKAGLCQLTRSIAFELGHHGVRCNAVCPGHTRTPMTLPDWTGDFLDNYLRRIPARRVAEPEEQAAVVLFLASDDASYVNGEAVVVDGGQLKGFWYLSSLEPPVRASPPDG